MKAGIQVVLCRCCTEMPALLDMKKLEAMASAADYVVSTVVVDAVCDGKNLADAVRAAREREADRVVVMACHKKDISPGLTKAYKRAGINEFLIEIANLREEVVLPHRDDPEGAQKKAESKLLATIAKSALLTPLEKSTEEMKTKNVVIIGAGVSGQAAARIASEAGAHTIMLEKSGKSVKAPGIVLPNTKVIGCKGYPGNYTLTIQAGEKIEQLDCAAVVIATGGGWTALRGPLASAVKDSIPLYKLYDQLNASQAPKSPVIIVDTPDPAGKTMKVQDYAWDETLETVIELKKKFPETRVFVVFQEMRAYGLNELAYKTAADLGVKFIRYEKASPPKVDPREPTKLSVKDFAQGEIVSIGIGTLAFASIPANPDNLVVAEALRIPMSPDGGIRRGSIQRGPVSTPRPAMFVCGSAMFPKSRELAAAEGEAAGAMAAAYVKSGKIEFGGSVAQVTQEKCSACLTCVRTCPYEAPFIGTASKAEIKMQLCQGCGICVGICPSKAIELHNHTDEQIAEEARTLLGGGF
jgi:heterodisulfide reductase subunit A-like polyferredoxin